MALALALLLLAAAPDAGSRQKAPKPKAPKGQMMKRNPTQISAAQKAAQSDDPKARSAAFLTLSSFGLEKRIPDPEPNDPKPRCAELASDLGCKSKAFVCNRSVEVDAEETHYSSLERMIGFGTTEAEAEADLPNHLFSRATKSGPDSTDTQCVVVFLDGCAKRAGMVCTTATETVGSATEAPATTEVFDLQFK